MAASLAQRVDPWLTLNARVGNIYTGSVFLALIDYLRQLADEGAERKLSLFSYGSGCGASLMVGRVADGAASWAQTVDPTPRLDARSELSIEAYEDVTRACEDADRNGADLADPARWGLESGLFYTGTVDHRRQYGRIGG